MSSGSLGALVVDVEDAVLVVVRIWAAVGVLELVDVLGVHRTLVVDVEDPILVVVRIWAAVLVLELVEVLGVVGTLVDVIGEAVAVAVARLRLRFRLGLWLALGEGVAEGEDRSSRWSAGTAGEAGAAGDPDGEAGGEEEAGAEGALERQVLSRRKPRECGRAIELTEEGEPVGGEDGQADAVGELVAGLEVVEHRRLAEPGAQVEGQADRPGPHLEEELGLPGDVALACIPLTVVCRVRQRRGQGRLEREADVAVVLASDSDPRAEEEVADRRAVGAEGVGKGEVVAAGHQERDRQSGEDHEPLPQPQGQPERPYEVMLYRSAHLGF